MLTTRFGLAIAGGNYTNCLMWIPVNTKQLNIQFLKQRAKTKKNRHNNLNQSNWSTFRRPCLPAILLLCTERNTAFITYCSTL